MENNKMNKDWASTEYYRERIEDCEGEDEFFERFSELCDCRQEQWAEKIDSIVKAQGDNKTKFAELCGVTRQTVYNWLNGKSIPEDRETFFRIALAAHYDEEQTNELLQKYGAMEALYPKVLEDCVFLYVLNQREKTLTYSDYEQILALMREEVQLNYHGRSADIETVVVKEQLQKAETEEKLQEFIAENSHIFAQAYSKLYGYIKMFLEANSNDHKTPDVIKKVAFGYTSSTVKQIYAVYNGTWMPTRYKIITLGLLINMDLDQINQLLSYAYMRPLYEKSIAETAIIYILTCADLEEDFRSEDVDTPIETHEVDFLSNYALQKLQKIYDVFQEKGIEQDVLKKYIQDLTL